MKKKFFSCLFFLLFSVLCVFPLYAEILSAIHEAVLLQDFKQVEVLSQQALSQNLCEKENHEVTYFLALSQLHQGNPMAARDLFQQLKDQIQEGDLYDRAFMGIINAYYLKGQYRESLRHCHHFARMRSDSDYMSALYLRIARINLKLSHWDPARRYLQTILKKYPDSLEAVNARQLLQEKNFFTVQVGAFLDQQYAHALATNLRNQGHYSYIVKTLDHQGRTFYRVRVGQTSSLNAARQLKERLLQAGFPAIVYP